MVPVHRKVTFIVISGVDVLIPLPKLYASGVHWLGVRTDVAPDTLVVPFFSFCCWDLLFTAEH